MKQKKSFLQAMPFIAMLFVLSISRIILERTYSGTSYTVTTAAACVLSILIMAVALVKSAKCKAYFICAVSTVAIICLLVKLIIAAFSIKLNFDIPLSTFEVIFLFVLIYFAVVGIVKKNIISMCLVLLVTIAYLIMWIFPDSLTSLRNTIGFNTYFNSHELFVILFGWIILTVISIVSHLCSKKAVIIRQGA